MKLYYWFVLFCLCHILLGCSANKKVRTEYKTKTLIPCDSLSQGVPHIGCECDDVRPHKLHSDSNHIYTMNEVVSLPLFPEGDEAKGLFIKNNRKLPLINSRKSKETNVDVEFIVEKDGSVTSMRVINSINKVYDDEALSILKKMPKWKPAIIDGKHVRCKMKILIPYREHSLGT